MLPNDSKAISITVKDKTNKRSVSIAVCSLDDFKEFIKKDLPKRFRDKDVNDNLSKWVYALTMQDKSSMSVWVHNTKDNKAKSLSGESGKEYLDVSPWSDEVSLEYRGSWKTGEYIIKHGSHTYNIRNLFKSSEEHYEHSKGYEFGRTIRHRSKALEPDFNPHNWSKNAYGHRAMSKLYTKDAEENYDPATLNRLRRAVRREAEEAEMRYYDYKKQMRS